VKDPFDVMPKATAEVFLRLQHEPLLHPFILIGGTALSLHLGHRQSENLNFVSVTFKLPRTTLQQLFDALQSEGYEVEDNDDYDAVFEFLNAGMELHEYSHTILVNKSVSITFFASDDPEGKILQATPEDSAGPRIATVREIAQLKALVAHRRSKSRDWFDLYVLDREHGFSLRDWREAYEKAELPAYDFEGALNRVCSGVLGTRDPGFRSLVADPPSVEDITAHFRARRDEYERAQSLERLPDSGETL
jgi:hypothetical protein